MSKKVTLSMCTMMVLSLIVCAPACAAGLLETAKTWLSAEVAALLVSAFAAFLAGITGLFYTRAVRTFKEAGEFLTTLSLALDDKRITREELAQIIREGRDIFRAWK